METFKVKWTYKYKSFTPILPLASEIQKYKEQVIQEANQKGHEIIDIVHEISWNTSEKKVEVDFIPDAGITTMEVGTIIAIITAIAGLLTAASQLIASIRDKDPEFRAYTYDHKFDDNVPPEWWSQWQRETGEKKPGQKNLTPLVALGILGLLAAKG